MDSLTDRNFHGGFINSNPYGVGSIPGGSSLMSVYSNDYLK